MRKYLLTSVMSLSARLLAGQDKARVDRYVEQGETWLSDRLQMHWHTHATQQYMDGEYYDHCGGDSAIVPTLQINGVRGHATVYQRPALEELSPSDETACLVICLFEGDVVFDLEPKGSQPRHQLSLDNDWEVRFPSWTKAPAISMNHLESLSQMHIIQKSIATMSMDASLNCQTGICRTEKTPSGKTVCSSSHGDIISHPIRSLIQD